MRGKLVTVGFFDLVKAAPHEFFDLGALKGNVKAVALRDAPPDDTCIKYGSGRVRDAISAKGNHYGPLDTTESVFDDLEWEQKRDEVGLVFA